MNTPKSDAREAYEAAWWRIDEQGVRPAKGRQSHTAWLVGDVLHIVDVWDSREDMLAFMAQLRPIVEELGMGLAEPEEGEILQIVRPN